jgi:cytoskeletal protein RodZ
MAIGVQLRAAREKRNLTASQVAAATRMKVQTVEALEAEDFGQIPAPIYVKGFLRTYAEYVGLDAKALVDEYLRRGSGPLSEPVAAPEPAPVAPVAPPPKPPKPVVTAAPVPLPQEPAPLEPARPEIESDQPQSAGPGMSFGRLVWLSIGLGLLLVFVLSSASRCSGPAKSGQPPSTVSE